MAMPYDTPVPGFNNNVRNIINKKEFKPCLNISGC
jgi:hypothetical protein